MAIVTRARALSVTAAAVGAAAFVVLGMPLPLLLGPMIGCLAVALAGGRLQGMGWLGTADPCAQRRPCFLDRARG